MVKIRRTAKSAAIDLEIGARIRIRRRTLGITQKELATALKITFQQVQKYETGQNAMSASMLLRTAAILQLSTSDLYPSLKEKASDASTLIGQASKSAIQLMEVHAQIRSTELRRRLLLTAKRFAAETAPAPRPTSRKAHHQRGARS